MGNCFVRLGTNFFLGFSLLGPTYNSIQALAVDELCEAADAFDGARVYNMRRRIHIIVLSTVSRNGQRLYPFREMQP